jgi:hypothetical protein
MNLTSSRSAKVAVSSTPSSLRKELRHLSKELFSSDVPNVVSLANTRVKATSRGAEKENFRPLSQSAGGNEWMRGGGAVSPAVFSFSGTSPPPHPQAFAAISSSAAAARSASSENGKANMSASQVSSTNKWLPGSAIPRGLMVSAILPRFDAI